MFSTLLQLYGDNPDALRFGRTWRGKLGSGHSVEACESPGPMKPGHDWIVITSPCPFRPDLAWEYPGPETRTFATVWFYFGRV